MRFLKPVLAKFCFQALRSETQLIGHGNRDVSSGWTNPLIFKTCLLTSSMFLSPPKSKVRRTSSWRFRFQSFQLRFPQTRSTSSYFVSGVLTETSLVNRSPSRSRSLLSLTSRTRSRWSNLLKSCTIWNLARALKFASQPFSKQIATKLRRSRFSSPSCSENCAQWNVRN